MDHDPRLKPRRNLRNLHCSAGLNCPRCLFLRLQVDLDLRLQQKNDLQGLQSHLHPAEQNRQKKLGRLLTADQSLQKCLGRLLPAVRGRLRGRELRRRHHLQVCQRHLQRLRSRI